MRRFALAISVCALALALRAEDKPDPRRKAVEDFAARVAKLEAASGDERDALRAEVRDAWDAFGAAHGPAGGALAIANEDGKLVLVVGGKGSKDGVPVVAANPPSGKKLRLRGGDGGEGGRAGRSAAWTGGNYGGQSGGNGGGTGGGRGGAFSTASGGTSVTGSTGANGKDAQGGGKNDLPSAEEIAAIAECADGIERMWDNDDKRRALIDTLEERRPSMGAVACFSSDGKLLILIGANGGDRNPDGVSVEVAGKPAEHVIAIAGNAGKNGKPGKAVAPEGAVAVDGK